MIVKSLNLYNFRNYSHFVIDFSQDINILIGNNGQGKTNLIEAIYLLSVGKSFRSHVNKQMIMFDNEFARIKGKVISNSKQRNLEIILGSNFKNAKIDNQDIHKICFIATDQIDVERAKKQLGDDVNMVIHDIFDATTINGELISKVDNKATAIKQVIDYLGIDKKDTIAFGDSMNDYEMINFVECGIAMGNACKELKEVASRICRSVDEDGIYYEFIELGLI